MGAQHAAELALLRGAHAPLSLESMPRRPYVVLLGLFDLFALWAAWMATIEIRVLLNPWMRFYLTREELHNESPPVLAVLALWLLAAWRMGVYRRPPGTSMRRRAIQVLEAALIAGVLNIVVIFLWRELGMTQLSRSFVLLFLPVSIVALSGTRWLAQRAIRAIEHQWPAPERVGVIGRPPEARLVVETLRNSGHRLLVPGVILPDRDFAASVPVRVLGGVDELGAIINTNNLERLVVVNHCLSDDQAERCARIARRMGVTLSETIGRRAPDVRLSVSQVGGISLLESRPAALRPGQELVKRSFDLLAAAATLIVLSPLLLVVALAVHFSSPGPVLYISPRVGRGGKRFPFFKFRSMRMATDEERRQQANEKSGHIYKVKGDSRITRVGHTLRRYSLDELPQLLNVLRGEMSLVGPRPLPAEDLDTDGMSREFFHWAEHRSRVLPGITGLWQVSGRSELSFDEMVRLDVDYIQKWSLWLDLGILLETPMIVVRGRGAY